MLFKFKAQRSTGEVYEDTKEFADKTALLNELKKQGDSIINAEEINSRSHNFGLKIREFSFGVSTHEKIIFARNLGSMLVAGLSLSRALTILEKQTNSSKLKEIIEKINEDIKKGRAFHEALSNYPNVFSSLFVSMVKAGEEGGTLAQSLKIVSSQMNAVYSLQRKVRGAMMYPAIIVFAMFVIAALMLIYVVPSLVKTFSDLNITLPASTRFIIFISNLLEQYTIYVFGALVLVILGLYRAAKSENGKKVIDKLILKIPMIAPMVKEANSARTARTLSSLLSSGLEVVHAMNITREVVQNSEYRAVIEKASKVIEKGDPMSQVFSQAEKLYPPFVGEMIAVGEETGNLSEMLMEVASFYEESVEQKTKDLSTIIEPFLMIVIGLAVGYFAISMLQPIYSIVDKI